MTQLVDQYLLPCPGCGFIVCHNDGHCGFGSCKCDGSGWISPPLVERLLREAHYILDGLNSEMGGKHSYCLFCSAHEYNALVGIVHTPDCIIQRIKEAGYA